MPRDIEVLLRFASVESGHGNSGFWLSAPSRIRVQMHRSSRQREANAEDVLDTRFPSFVTDCDRVQCGIEMGNRLMGQL